MIKGKALDTKCPSCGKEKCHCQERIDKFNESLEKCKECDFPIYEGLDHIHNKKRSFAEIIEGIERRSQQRRKKWNFIMIGNFIWIIVVFYYVIFTITLEIYLLLFLGFIMYIFFVNRLIKIEPLDLDDL